MALKNVGQIMYIIILTSTFDIEEIDIMGCSMDHCPKCHRVGNLPMKPDVRIGWKYPSKRGPKDANDIA